MITVLHKRENQKNNMSGYNVPKSKMLWGDRILCHIWTEKCYVSLIFRQEDYGFGNAIRFVLGIMWDLRACVVPSIHTSAPPVINHSLLLVPISFTRPEDVKCVWSGIAAIIFILLETAMFCINHKSVSHLSFVLSLFCCMWTYLNFFMMWCLSSLRWE